MKKRLLPALLALVMVLGLLPLSVLAAQPSWQDSPCVKLFDKVQAEGVVDMSTEASAAAAACGEADGNSIRTAKPASGTLSYGYNNKASKDTNPHNSRLGHWAGLYLPDTGAGSYYILGRKGNLTDAGLDGLAGYMAKAKADSVVKLDASGNETTELTEVAIEIVPEEKFIDGDNSVWYVNADDFVDRSLIATIATAVPKTDPNEGYDFVIYNADLSAVTLQEPLTFAKLTTNTEFYGKYSDDMGDFTVEKDADDPTRIIVTGTANYLDQYSGWQVSSEEAGHYLPINITGDANSKFISINRTEGAKDGKVIGFEADGTQQVALYLDGEAAEGTLAADLEPKTIQFMFGDNKEDSEAPVYTLDFSGVVLLPKPDEETGTQVEAATDPETGETTGGVNVKDSSSNVVAELPAPVVEETKDKIVLVDPEPVASGTPVTDLVDTNVSQTIQDTIVPDNTTFVKVEVKASADASENEYIADDALADNPITVTINNLDSAKTYYVFCIRDDKTVTSFGYATPNDNNAISFTTTHLCTFGATDVTEILNGDDADAKAALNSAVASSKDSGMALAPGGGTEVENPADSEVAEVTSLTVSAGEETLELEVDQLSHTLGIGSEATTTSVTINLEAPGCTIQAAVSGGTGVAVVPNNAVSDSGSFAVQLASEATGQTVVTLTVTNQINESSTKTYTITIQKTQGASGGYTLFTQEERATRLADGYVTVGICDTGFGEVEDGGIYLIQLVTGTGDNESSTLFLQTADESGLKFLCNSNARLSIWQVATVAEAASAGDVTTFTIDDIQGKQVIYDASVMDNVQS